MEITAYDEQPGLIRLNIRNDDDELVGIKIEEDEEAPFGVSVRVVREPYDYGRMGR